MYADDGDVAFVTIRSVRWRCPAVRTKPPLLWEPSRMMSGFRTSPNLRQDNQQSSFTRKNNEFAWFWWCGVPHNRSVPSKSPTVLAAGSWRQVARWWPSTSWHWLPPKERAQFCSQVTKCFFVCVFVVFWCKYLPLAINAKKRGGGASR